MEGCHLLRGHVGSPDIWIFDLRLLTFVDGESYFKDTYKTTLQFQIDVDKRTNEQAQKQGFHVLRLSYEDKEIYVGEIRRAISDIQNQLSEERSKGITMEPLLLWSPSYSISESDSECVSDGSESGTEGEASKESGTAETVDVNDASPDCKGQPDASSPPQEPGVSLEEEADSDAEVQPVKRSGTLLAQAVLYSDSEETSGSGGSSDAESSDGVSNDQALPHADVADEPKCSSPTCSDECNDESGEKEDNAPPLTQVFLPTQAIDEVDEVDNLQNVLAEIGAAVYSP